MSHGIVKFVTGLAVLAVLAGTAEAGGARVMGGGSPWNGQTSQRQQHFQQRPRVVDTPPAQVTLPRHAFPVHPRPPVRPGYPYLGYGYGLGYGCCYSAPSYSQYVPGYWSYVFVPQQATTSAWVPGYYDTDGVWVAGYYASQTVQGGYYQPYWVQGGYWSP